MFNHSEPAYFVKMLHNSIYPDNIIKFPINSKPLCRIVNIEGLYYGTS
jgi:hypothetical protein